MYIGRASLCDKNRSLGVFYNLRVAVIESTHCAGVIVAWCELIKLVPDQLLCDWINVTLYICVLIGILSDERLFLMIEYNVAWFSLICTIHTSL